MEYSFEHCLKVAKNKGSLEALAANEPLVYKRIYQCRWIIDAENYILYRGKYKIEDIFEVALRYPSSSEWRDSDNHGNSYLFASRSGWLGYCDTARRNNKYTDNELLLLANKFLDVNDLCREYPYAFGYIVKRQLKDKACEHMKVKYMSAGTGFTFNRCLKSALRYKHKKGWKDSAPDYYKNAYSNGWLAAITIVAGWYVTLNSKIRTKILSSALQYKYKSDWLLAENSLYALAKYHSIFDIATAHMVDKPKTYAKTRAYRIDKSTCIGVAQRYKTRTEFARAEPSFYNAARIKGYLDEACVHMSRALTTTVT